MDVYKSPESDVEIESNSDFKPIRAIIYGLLVSIVLVMFVSIIESIVFAIALGADLTSEAAVTAALSNSSLYLTVDLVIMALILFFAGRVVRKYTPRKEILFGLVLTFITLGVYILLVISAETYLKYPIWYNVFSVVVIFSAISYGAKPRKMT